LLGALRPVGRLHRAWVRRRPAQVALLDDYAYLVAALRDLFEASADPAWLAEALDLQSTLDAHFADTSGAYALQSDLHPPLLATHVPSQDAALPSQNAVAASNLLHLHAITAD